MRRDFFVLEDGEQVRFRCTATRVRREVILDAPAPPGSLEEAAAGDRYVHRMRFGLEEAQALVALLIEAIAVASR